MEEKKLIKVDTTASQKIAAWRILCLVLGVLSIIATIVVSIIGIVELSDYMSDSTVLIVGVSLIVPALLFFFNAVLLRGFKEIVKNAEYKNAIIEDNYRIKEIE